jgi:hypothetical protein
LSKLIAISLPFGTFLEKICGPAAAATAKRGKMLAWSNAL